ncbi:hypothetical protein KQI82_01500 [Oscillibacter sp. MSJ-2]|uniref:Uncharacterized protein n=1 Tax=Dysosmobacter acutus TaxID=2841504 RepID=A0ABS6F5N8_9FIRM|nr:hypothetical protein [Dysosmobacter acutus]MBU5625608.1 hypothetical protein [Dysosmobacter acutus]
MKRLAVWLLLIVCMTTWAAADVIWVPEDDFLNKHMDEAQHEGRSYYANSPRGSVCLYKEPLGQEAIERGENGFVVGKTLGEIQNEHLMYIDFTLSYEGQLWGVAEYTTGTDGDLMSWKTGDDGGTGWVRMSEMTVRYDQRSFEEEHGADFAAYGGGYDSLLTDQTLCLYEYPGSGSFIGEIKGDQDYPVAFSETWTDEDGQVWGHVPYHMGMRGWVCLHDPADSGLPQMRGTEYDFYPKAVLEFPVGEEGSSSTLQTAPETADSSLWIAVVLVLGVSGVTLLMLSVMRRKRN